MLDLESIVVFDGVSHYYCCAPPCCAASSASAKGHERQHTWLSPPLKEQRIGAYVSRHVLFLSFTQLLCGSAIEVCCSMVL
jgi:hypothetical protein